MITLNNREAVLKWQRYNGGHNHRPAAHALKTLDEMVELCVASGATAEEIRAQVQAGIAKADRRGEFSLERPVKNGGRNFEAMKEEVADVMICMILLTENNNIDADEEVGKKLPILNERHYEADPDGVLRRP